MLSNSLGINSNQVVWGIRSEMAQTVEDILARRTRALFLDAEEAMRIAPEVARIMAAETGKNGEWETQQVRDFQELAKTYRLS